MVSSRASEQLPELGAAEFKARRVVPQESFNVSHRRVVSPILRSALDRHRSGSQREHLGIDGTVTPAQLHQYILHGIAARTIPFDFVIEPSMDIQASAPTSIASLPITSTTRVRSVGGRRAFMKTVVPNTP
jgi:hypothetical protein